MPCLLTILALAVPRLVIVLLWLFSGWFSGIFTSWIWPVLGFLFLPTTLLWYSAVQHWFGGVWSFGPILGLIVAVLIDVSPSGRRRRRRSD